MENITVVYTNYVQLFFVEVL